MQKHNFSVPIRAFEGGGGGGDPLSWDTFPPYKRGEQKKKHSLDLLLNITLNFVCLYFPTN